MKKNAKRWIIAISAALCLLAILLILGTCGGGTLQEEISVEKFADNGRELAIIDSSDYAVRAGVEAEAASVVLATPWGVLLRFSAPEGYFMTSYSVNGGEPVGVKRFDEADHFVVLTPGENIGISVRYKSTDRDGLYMYTFSAD